MTRKTGTLTNAARFPDRWIDLDSGPVIVTPARIGNHFRVLLTENCTLEGPNFPHSGQRIVWRFQQPPAGGVTVTPNSGSFAAGNSSLSVDTGAGAVSYVEALYDDQGGLWEVLGSAANAVSTDDLLSSSSGAGDAGQPIKLDPDGYLDPSFVETGSALTQTYPTATTTHANPTASSLTDGTGGTAGAGLVPISGTGSDVDINDNFATQAERYNQMFDDLINLKQFVNQLADDAQAFKKPG